MAEEKPDQPEVKKEEKAEAPKAPEKSEKPAQAEKSDKPAKAEKPKEEAPAEGSKNRGKKVSQMTLQEVEAGLKMAQEKMGGFQSGFARNLLTRRDSLFNEK